MMRMGAAIIQPLIKENIKLLVVGKSVHKKNMSVQQDKTITITIQTIYK